MQETKHFNERKKTRHIPEQVIDFTLKYGEVLQKNPDRILLSEKTLNNLDKGIQIPNRVYKQVPICVVFKDSMLITIFRPSKNISKEKRRKIS